MRARFVRLFATLALASACSSSSSAPPASAPPKTCAVDEETLDDGSCQAPGVPPNECGAGFTADGEGGCNAIMPDTCAPGTLAVPGDTACRAVGVAEPPMCGAGQIAVVGDAACRAVAECGAAPWGAIPVDAMTVYVDASFSGTSDGTAAHPFTTIQAGVDAATSGAIVAIAAGAYAESVVVSVKPVKIWGRCPGSVSIVTSGGKPALTLGAAGAEAHQIAATGDGQGFLVSAAAVVDRVWAHATTAEGIAANASSTIKGSLVEGAHARGIIASAATVTIDATLVRDTGGATDGRFGNGLDTNTAATVTVTGSVFERNRDAGVYVEGATTTLDQCIVRDSLPRDADQKQGAGIGARAFGTVVVKRSRVVRNRAYGVVISASDATLDDVLVADTAPASDGTRGQGIYGTTPAKTDHVKITMTRSLVEKSHTYGVFLDGATLDMTSSSVRDTEPEMLDGFGGVGIEAAYGVTSGLRSIMTLRGVVAERNHAVAVAAIGSDLTIEESLIRGTLPDTAGSFGHGVQAEKGSTLAMRASVVASSMYLGVLIDDANATIERTTIRDVAPEPMRHESRGIQFQTMTDAAVTLTLSRSFIKSPGSMGIILADAPAKIDHTAIVGAVAQNGGVGGDGIEVIATTLDADHVRIVNVERASIAIFAATCNLSAASLTCAAFPLEAETVMSIDASYALSKDVKCGCPGPTDACQVTSSSLAPPSPVTPYRR